MSQKSFNPRALPEITAERDARRVAAFAIGLDSDPGTTLPVRVEVAADATTQPNPPDDAERLVGVRRRLLALAR